MRASLREGMYRIADDLSSSVKPIKRAHLGVVWGMPLQWSSQ